MSQYAKFFNMTSRERYLVITLLLCVAVSGTAFSESNTRVVAFNGQPVVGSTQAAGFRENPRRSFNSDGQVLISSFNGFLLNSGGVLEYHIQSGDVAPVPGETYRPALYHLGTITGKWPVQPGGRLLWSILDPSGDEALISEFNGVESIAANSGEAAEGTESAFLKVGLAAGPDHPARHVVMSDAGDVVFLAQLDSGNSLDDEGIWHMMPNGDRQLVAREGAQAPGLPPGSIFQGGISERPFERPLLAGPGTVVFEATVAIEGQGQVQSIWRGIRDPAGGCDEIADCLQAVIKSGDPVPGIGGDSIIGGFSDVQVNSHGGMAMTVFFRENEFALDERGVFVAPGPGLPSMVHRSGTSVFATKINVLALLDNGSMLVRAYGGIEEKENIQLFASNQLIPLIQAGDTHPDLPAGVTLTGSADFAINRRGQIALMAGLLGAGVGNGNNEALFGVNSVGESLEFIFREGDNVPVGAGECELTRMKLYPDNAWSLSRNSADGQPAIMSDAGEVLWWSNTQVGGDCPTNQVILASDLGEPNPTARPELIAIEPMQVVQDWDLSIPMIEHKKTLVRAHFYRGTPTVLYPRLRAFRDNLELQGSPLEVMNSGGRVYVRTNPQVLRGLNNMVAQYELPRSWTQGDITLEIDGGGEPIDCREGATPEASDCQVDISFEPVVQPELVYVDYAWAPRSGGAVNRVTFGQTVALAGRLVSAFPVLGVRWTRRLMVWPRELSNPPDANSFPTMLNRLKLVRKADNCGVTTACSRVYMGLVANGNASAGLGEAAGIGSSVAISIINSNLNAQGRTSHIHEFGHMLGIAHSVDSSLGLFASKLKQGHCGSFADADSPDFPWFQTILGIIGPTLGPMTNGQNALVFGWESSLRQVVDPNSMFDLMGYCRAAPVQRWPSSHTYLTLKNNIELQFGTLPEAMFMAKSQGAPSDYMVFRGIVNIPEETVDLLPMSLLEGVMAPDSQPPGDYTLRLLDDGDGIIQDIPLAVDIHPDSDPPLSTGDFAVAIPLDPAISAYEVLLAGEVLASSEATANAPQVAITAPMGGALLDEDTVTIEWSASDADDDKLVFSVQYSQDNGVSWTALAVDLVESSLELPRNQFQATGNGLIRVQASDGFNFGSSVSSSFTVSNNSPEVTVTSPIEGDLLVGGQLLHLEAVAFDVEDGLIMPEFFSWISDLDGDLGTGNPLEVPVSGLQDGEHLITVTAEDSSGASAEATVRIRISQSAPDKLADLSTYWLDTPFLSEAGPTAARVVIRNEGPEAAQNVSVSFGFSSEDNSSGSILTPIDPPFGWSCAGTDCTIDQLQPGDQTFIELKVELTIGSMQLSAEASSEIIDPVLANSRAELRLGVWPDPGAIYSDSFE
jgi:hypothetical protein